jgi:hypothetical protein
MGLLSYANLRIFEFFLKVFPFKRFAVGLFKLLLNRGFDGCNHFGVVFKGDGRNGSFAIVMDYRK